MSALILALGFAALALATFAALRIARQVQELLDTASAAVDSASAAVDSLDDLRLAVESIAPDTAAEVEAVAREYLAELGADG